jgi:regulator of protease activity HflC (stomatin/prohibitin superfamily)
LAAAVNLCCLPLTILLCCGGLFVLNEKQESAVLYYGKYVGSVSTPGIHALPPCGMEMRMISTATRTVDMKNLKVVDRRGNPVIVGAVVTFVATSPKKARIDVQDPWPNASWQPAVSSGTYLQLQAQAVLKQVTSQFPYEAPDGEPSLQTEGAHITQMLVTTLQQRVNNTGAKILSFDLVDLSYAPEIAQSMLLRQQAIALVEARQLIVEAAVDMTHSAVERLQAKRGSPLSNDAIERISTNLLTVVCSNEAVTPTVSMK